MLCARQKRKGNKRIKINKRKRKEEKEIKRRKEKYKQTRGVQSNETTRPEK